MIGKGDRSITLLEIGRLSEVVFDKKDAKAEITNKDLKFKKQKVKWTAKQ